jgi:hypothetical protein
VYSVKDKTEAISVYLMFDNSLATESGNDKMYGAFRYHGFQPRHKSMFINTGLQTGLKQLVFPNKWEDIKLLTTLQLVTPWIPTLTIIDSIEKFYNHAVFPAAVTCAMVATIRRDGFEGLEFWSAYHNDAGTKSKATVDGVEKARILHGNLRTDALNSLSGMSSGGMIGAWAPRFIDCYEKWMDGKRFPIHPGTGNKRRNQPASLSTWWKNNIGDYDQPQIHSQKNLDLAV